MSPATDRLTRRLARRSDLVAVGDGPGSAVVRRGQLLVPAARAAEVTTTLSRWVDRREDHPDLGVSRLHLRGGADVPDLLEGELRGDGDPVASPVHVFTAEPAYAGGPVHDPRPVVDLRATVGPVGRGTDVAILDTGLAPHTWFPAGSWEPLGFAGVTDRADPELAVTDPADDLTGHGTFVAGIVRQVAPSAHLVVGRLLGSDGVCDELELIAAIHRVAARSRATRRTLGVLNLSFGGFTWQDRRPLALARALLSLDPQTVVVAAAGNAGGPRPFWPAALPSVVGVGALEADGSTPAPFSGRGSWVDAWARGVDVTSSIAGRPEHTGRTSAQAIWSGTSFAAAHVTGLIARRAGAGGNAAAVTPGLLRTLSGPHAAPRLTHDPVTS